MEKLFGAHYANQRRSVVMVADLARGWERRKKTFGFFRSTWIPYKNDLKIRLQLALIAQPATFGEWAQEFPELQIDAGDEMLSYQMHQRKLSVTVSLSPEQPWRRTEQGRPELFVEQLPLFKLGPNQWFDLRAWIVFHEPTPPPIPDVRVWVEKQSPCARRTI